MTRAALRVFTVLFLISFSGKAPAQTAVDAAGAQAHFIRGVGYGRQGDYDRAIAEFSEALRLKPDPVTFYSRAFTYSIKGEFDRAISDNTEALRLKPVYFEALFNRAGAYAAKRDFDRAIADCSEAIRLRPDYADAYYNRGVNFTYKGEYAAAKTDYTKVLRLVPNHVLALYQRGFASFKTGEQRAAIADFSAALRLKPGHAEALLYRGIAYGILSDLEHASADLTEYIRLNPSNPMAFETRSSVYEGQGKAALAKSDRETARHLTDTNAAAVGPQQPGVLFKESEQGVRAGGTEGGGNPRISSEAEKLKNSAVAAMNAGRLDEAIADLDQAIRLQPDYGEAYLHRGNVFSKKGERYRAIGDLADAIRFKPAYASLLAKMEFPQLARAAGRVVDPDTVAPSAKPNAYLVRGAVRAQHGENAEAIADLSEAIRLQADLAAAYLTRGIIYLRSGEIDRAVADLKEASRIKGGSRNPG